MKDYAAAFYKGRRWRETREAYAKSVGYLCERCLRKGLYQPGEIVHHKVHITPENISDPNVTLTWDNLELLCRKCHEEMHKEASNARYFFTDDGQIVRNSPPY